MSAWGYELSDLIRDQTQQWPDRMKVRLFEALASLCKDPGVGRHYQGDAIWSYKDTSARPHIHITYAVDKRSRRVKALVAHATVIPVFEIHVFLSYSHADHEWFKRLREALRPLEEYDICFWSDQDIVGGQTWLDLILEKVKDASAALLLVSKHFLSSSFIRKHELGRFLARAEDRAGGPFILLWVALMDFEALKADVMGNRLLRYQALLNPKKPLHQIKSKKSLEGMLVKLREEANRAIYRGIRRQ